MEMSWLRWKKLCLHNFPHIDSHHTAAGAVEQAHTPGCAHTHTHTKITNEPISVTRLSFTCPCRRAFPLHCSVVPKSLFYFPSSACLALALSLSLSLSLYRLFSRYLSRSLAPFLCLTLALSLCLSRSLSLLLSLSLSPSK